VASSSAYDDTDPSKRTYEIIGPQIFRFEYYYLEKTTGSLVAYPAPWTSLSTVAIGDAAAIVVAIAVIDPASKVLLSNSQIAMLVESLPDYVSGSAPGELPPHGKAPRFGVAGRDFRYPSLQRYFTFLISDPFIFS
jgi:hypothetical protein